jgi:transcriptional regulator with XRE-family HTH domain
MYAPHPLQVWRESRQLKHRDLAEMFGVDRATISRWEGGTKRISVLLLPLVAEKTGIPAAKLRPDLAALFVE